MENSYSSADRLSVISLYLYTLINYYAPFAKVAKILHLQKFLYTVRRCWNSALWGNTPTVFTASLTILYQLHHLLVCAWENQSENQYFICNKVSSMLYSKYITVVRKYSIVNLIIVCVKNSP